MRIQYTPRKAITATAPVKSTVERGISRRRRMTLRVLAAEAARSTRAAHPRQAAATERVVRGRRPELSLSSASCRSRSSSSRTAARSRFASSARAASSASRPWPSLLPTTRARSCALGRRGSRSPATSTPRSTSVPRRSRRRRDSSRLRVSRRDADFAEAVEAAGLTWVGPPPEALRLGGDKLAAKRIAREAGVPVLPDGHPASSASRSS